jgi:hypothetical protein
VQEGSEKGDNGDATVLKKDKKRERRYHRANGSEKDIMQIPLCSGK